MTQENSTNLESLAESLALRILGGEEKPDIRPLPVTGRMSKKIKNEYLRAKAQKILELRVKGFSFEEIAETLDYKSGKHVQTAYERFMDKFEREDVNAIRQLQAERLEMAWRGLAPKIEQGRERAVEVGMKVLERQSRLLGVDIADQIAEKTTNQPIQINIMAHPGDSKAKDLIIEHRPQLLEEENK